MNQHPRLRQMLVAVNVLCATGLVIFIGWLLYLEPPYLQYRNLPFPVLSENAKAGQVVPVTVTRCSTAKDTRVYTMGRTLICEGQQPFELQSATAAIRPGCHTSTSLLNVLPASAPSARCHIEGVAEIAGTIRTHTVRWSSAPFSVVALP